VQAHLGPETLDDAPEPRFAIEALGEIPGGLGLAEQVEEDHPVVGHCAEQGPPLRRLPEARVVDEDPPLHDPDGLRIARRHGPVHRLAHARQELGLVGRGRHLDERVRGVQMVRAELPRLLLDEGLADAFKERVGRVDEEGARELAPTGQAAKRGLREHPLERLGHVARESLQHRGHAQLTLSGEDSSLQFGVALDPGLRQRPAPAVDAAHPAEGQISGPDQELGDLPVAQAQVAIDLVPHGLLPGDRQRHVDPVQGHPVDHPLPLRPVPEGQRVTERAVVETVAVLEWARAADLFRHGREGLRQAQLIAAPRHVAIRVVLQVPVEPRRNGHAIGAAHDHLAIPRLHLEHVLAVLLRDGFEHELPGPLRQEPAQ